MQLQSLVARRNKLPNVELPLPFTTSLVSLSLANNRLDEFQLDVSTLKSCQTLDLSQNRLLMTCRSPITDYSLQKCTSVRRLGLHSPG